jgi:dTDP-4-amino-4,6-dideoxygalactose transaminase
MNRDAALAVIAPVVARMPDPTGSSETEALEHELAQRFGARHAVTTSSGTAALHTALAAAGIGTGAEVLLPAATVVMTVAAIVATGAHPVFVDSPPGQLGMDPDDAAAKIGPRTRALVCVHLFGRTHGLTQAADLARMHGLLLIEDACQAQGSRHHDHEAGTVGAIGCFSLKDGKILACGEGGYLLTDDHTLAAQASSWRNHGLTPVPGAAAGTRLGHNFRLAQPLAALARYHLAGFDAALSQRRSHHDRLVHALAGTPGLEPLPATTGHNGYSPVWHISLPKPRAFAARLSELGVVNSVGTFGLRAAPLQPWCSPLEPAPCPNATELLDQLLAITLTARHQDHDLDELAAVLDREACAWA